MKFSNLVEAGLQQFVQTKGPTFDEAGDPWRAACWGYLGRAPTLTEYANFYHMNPLGVKFGDPGEFAVRLMIVYGVTWKQFLSQLRWQGL